MRLQWADNRRNCVIQLLQMYFSSKQPFTLTISWHKIYKESSSECCTLTMKALHNDPQCNKPHQKTPLPAMQQPCFNLRTPSTANPESYRLHVIGRYALHYTTFFDLHPSISRILFDEHESLTFRHTVFSVTSSCVLIERFYVFEFLGTAFGSDGWPLLFGYAAGDGRAGI